MIFHNYVLFSEFKYKLEIMQLRLKPKRNNRLLVKTILFVVTFSIVIFLLDKIEISAPSELIQKVISNDKIITLK